MMATRTSIGLAVLALTLTAAAAAAASSGEAESIATNGAPDGHCDGGVDCDTSISATNTADELPPLRLDDLDLAAYRASVGKGKWFVKFFAPWCKHCQALAPHWRDLAIKLHAGPDDVNVGIVDCTKADDVCAGEAVRGYPTLRFYDGDFHKDYKGVRTLPAIETFVNRALEPSTTAITSMEELVALQAVHSVIFLSFSTAESGAGSDEGAVADPDESRPDEWDDAFATAAGQSRFVARMFTTTNMAILESIRVGSASVANKPTKLVVLKDGEALRYPGTAASLAISTWIQKNRYPAVVELTHSVAFDIKKEFPDLWIASLIVFGADNNTALLESYATLARKPGFAAKFQFTYMNYETWKEYIGKRWSLGQDDVSALVVLNTQTQDFVVVAKGEQVGSVSSGLDIALLREGLQTVANGDARWRESENTLEWIRNSVFKSTESAIFMIAALQAEHPMLVHLTGLTTSLLLAVMLKQCCCPNVSGIKAKGD